jgi:hypothetical protein
MKAVLALWPERSWESCRQRVLGRPVIARSLSRTIYCERARTVALLRATRSPSAPGRWPVVLCLGLGAAKKIASPGGAALRPGLVPAGWGAFGRCPLARFGVWGGNGPGPAAAGAGALALVLVHCTLSTNRLIGLTSYSYSYLSPVPWPLAAPGPGLWAVGCGLCLCHCVYSP